MFKDIYKIDWANISHVYGKSGEIPQKLRDLISTDIEIRENSIDYLKKNLLHQFDLIEVHLYIIPFLLELLEIENLSNKEFIIFLLFAIAEASFPKDSEYEFQFYLEKVKKEGNENELINYIEGNKFANKVHKEIGTGIDIYLKLLEDSDPSVREYAAMTLAYCKKKASKIIPILLKQIKSENNKSTQINMIISLTIINQESQYSADYYYNNQNIPLIVEFCLMWRICVLKKEKTPVEIIEKIIEIFMNKYDDILEEFEDLGWYHFPTPADALEYIGIGAKEYFSILLSDFYEKKNEYMLDDLLYLVFPESIDNKKLNNLTKDQITLLNELSKASSLWDHDDEYDYPTLLKLGLPTNRKEIKNLLDVVK